MKPPSIVQGQAVNQAVNQAAVANTSHLRGDAMVKTHMQHVLVGDKLAQDVITRRCGFDVLTRYALDANSDDPRVSGAGMSVLLGFARTAASVIEAGARAGVYRISGQALSARDVEYAFSINRQRAASFFRAVCITLFRILEQCPAMDVTFGEKAGRGTKEDKPAEPLEVRITALPDRVTTSTVERNSAGNIVSSTQTESDAA